MLGHVNKSLEFRRLTDQILLRSFHSKAEKMSDSKHFVRLIEKNCQIARGESKLA